MADAERAEELLIEQFTGSDGREAVARRNAEILQALRDLQLPQAPCFDHSSASRNGQLATAHESVQPVQTYGQRQYAIKPRKSSGRGDQQGCGTVLNQLFGVEHRVSQNRTDRPPPSPRLFPAHAGRAAGREARCCDSEPAHGSEPINFALSMLLCA